MTVTQLEAFVMVADLRSFTVAAMRLGISQSAVSHAIRSLETELGVRLFRRLKSDTLLTEIGASLLLRAREMIGLFETMRQEAADAQGLKQGTLRIGSFGPTSSLRLLPALLKGFRKEYPDIEVHIDEGPDQAVMQWILDRRVEVGFVVLPDDRFETYVLAEDQMVALLPLHHPLAANEAVRLDELCSDPFIMTEAGSAKIVMNLFNAANLSPKVRYRSSQLMSTLALVGRGEGITILGELALPLSEQCPDLEYVTKPLNPPVSRQIGLAVHNARHLSPATQAFIKLAQTLKQHRQLA